MRAKAVRLVKWSAILLAVILLTVLVVRAYDSQRGPPLELWHTYVPHEMTAAEIGKADWAEYLAAEQTIFSDVRSEVDRQAAIRRPASPANRYFDGSPIYPGDFAHDWNRSYVLEPAGAPVGAVVLLHGLTDSPYSLRHVARRYRDARLRRDRDPAAGPRHRARRPDRRRLGGLDRRRPGSRCARRGGARARRRRCTSSASRTAARWR